MKTKLLTIGCACLFLCWTSTPALAEAQPGGATMMADAVFVRPVCFVATVLGSAFFVVTLPVTAPSKSVKKAANAFVSKPAKATFSRPLGDVDVLLED